MTVSGTPAFVLVPVGYLERVIANLVDNARRFAATPRRRGDRRHGQDGHPRGARRRPGRAAGRHERIFERFVRLDEARDREHGGFGLGLAIVADLCRAYGGTIETRRQPGAVFLVRFPLARTTRARQPRRVSATGVRRTVPG